MNKFVNAHFPLLSSWLTLNLATVFITICYWLIYNDNAIALLWLPIVKIVMIPMIIIMIIMIIMIMIMMVMMMMMMLLLMIIIICEYYAYY